MPHALSTVVAASAAVLLGTTTPALAEGGYLEGVLGIAIPVADDDYAELDESLKLGFRLGNGSGATAIELSGDFTPFGRTSTTPLGDVDIGFDRFRLLVGVRHHIPLDSVAGGTLFLRAGLGGELVRFSARGDLIGVDLDIEDSDPGLAAEVGAGLSVPVRGKMYLGFHVAVPLAFHFDEDDPSDPEDGDLDYTGVDLDLLLVLGTRM